MAWLSGKSMLKHLTFGKFLGNDSTRTLTRLPLQDRDVPHPVTSWIRFETMPDLDRNGNVEVADCVGYVCNRL